MKIRTKLTLIFFFIVTVILTAVSLSIYFFSANYRESDFYARMRNKAENTARILVVVDEIDSDLLKRIERDNPANLPNERITIYNYKNQELYDSDVSDMIPDNLDLIYKIKAEEEVRFRHGEYEVLGFVFNEKGGAYIVIAAATDITGFTKLKNLQEILLFVFGASLVFVSIIGWVYAGRILAPISTIVSEVDNISAARLDLRLDEGNKTDEIAKLSQTFNKMLDRLETSFLVQKNFIANASHELRTPITAIAGEIDVTLLQQRAPEKYISVLHSISDEMRNLKILSNQLLLLAQASSDRLEHLFSNLRVDEVLWLAKEDLKKAHPEYIIQIELDLMLNEESLVINGDEQLIKASFSNLMDNACRYSSDNRVIVKLKAIDGLIVVEFSNQGVGIAEEDIASIFNPFFRGKNTRDIKGHGIGLSLVERIITLHKGSIGINSVMNETTTFVVSLPMTC